jgi:hypothetical protein
MQFNLLRASVPSRLVRVDLSETRKASLLSMTQPYPPLSLHVSSCYTPSAWCELFSTQTQRNSYDNFDYCTHRILWQLEHPDCSSCFAFSLLFRGFIFDCSDLPEFRASLLVVSLGPIAFSTLGGWPRAIFTKMSICTAVETSGEALCWLPFRDSINMFLIITITPGLI